MKTLIWYLERTSDYFYGREAFEVSLQLNFSNEIWCPASAVESFSKRYPQVKIRAHRNRVFESIRFLSLDADYLLTTMVDIDQFHLKRLKNSPTKYIYVFHSLISTHKAYRQNAFDAFDWILCAGPHHQNEISLREKTLQLRSKNLIAFGYQPIEDLKILKERDQLAKPKAQILIAPTWNSELSQLSNLKKIVALIDRDSFDLKIQLHEQIVRQFSEKVPDELRQLFVDRNTESLDVQDRYRAMLQSDLLITDISGIAFEFRLGLNRPVIFWNSSTKIQNHNWLPILVIEEEARPLLGSLFYPEKTAQSLNNLIKESLKTSAEKKSDRLEKYYFSNTTGRRMLAEQFIAV